MVSGSTGGVTSDCTPAQCPQRQRTLFQQVAAHGGSWRVLAESMPADCRRTDAGPYVVRHNPATYFPAIAADCRRFDRPMGFTTGGRLADLVRDRAAAELPAGRAEPVPQHPRLRHRHRRRLAVRGRAADRRRSRLPGRPHRVMVTWDEGKGGYGGAELPHDRGAGPATSPPSSSRRARGREPGRRPGTTTTRCSKTTERLLGIRHLPGSRRRPRTTSMRPAFRL